MSITGGFSACFNQTVFLFWKPSLIHNTQFTVDLAPVPDGGSPPFCCLKVARYRAFSSAVSLGNTLLCWFNFRYVEFRDSMALVVLYRYHDSTTNIIEGLNRQYRKVTRTKSVSPSDVSLEKMLYLASENVIKKWTQRYRNWDQVLNQLIVLYGERLSQYF